MRQSKTPARSRLTLKTYSDTTPTAHFQYDTPPAWAGTWSNPVGRLTSFWTNATATGFGYDSMGRVVRNDQCAPLNCSGGSWRGPYRGPTHSSITYGYDLAGRRASMTVAGQPQVTYSYDNAKRLTQIAQGTSTVGFSYDTANRRSTLSNGVNMADTYDNDSRMTGITYKFNAATLGNLTYSYDSLGRRTQVGGSFAQTGFPGSITSATYDAANELTNWNGTPISYDLNGNMLSDGTNAFSWNARNQVALNNVSLQYDGAGRRIKNGAGRRIKNAAETSFLYDGANATQELSGSMPTANLISGGIDEIFTRADSTGTFTPLKDALGSMIALVDASGNLVTRMPTILSAIRPLNIQIAPCSTNSPLRVLQRCS